LRSHFAISNLQNPDAYLPSETLKQSDEGRELNVGPSPFNPGDKTFFCADSIGELFLRESSTKPFIFQLLSNDKSVALHLKLFALRRSLRTKVLRDKVFNRG